MKTWQHLAVVGLALAGLVLVTVGYSRRLGDDLLARLEIEQLERIPVLDED